jgi:hypothetical protein
VPITEKRAAYVVLETAAPSHRSHPEGAEEPANWVMDPDGTSKSIVDDFRVKLPSKVSKNSES